MINKTPESSTSVGANMSLDQETAQNTYNILALKQRVIDEINSDGFPDLGFLFSDEILPVLWEIFDEMLAHYSQRFQKLYKMENSDIRFKDIPEFDALTYVYNLIYHTSHTRWTKVSEQLSQRVGVQMDTFCEEINQSDRYY